MTPRRIAHGRAALAALIALAALPLAPRPAAADLPSPGIERLLLASRSPLDVRARLVAHADSVSAADPNEAGEALYWAGAGHARAGHADSALALLARARAVRGGPDERLLLAEMLATRGGPGDADSARAVLAPLAGEAFGGVSAVASETRLLRTWLRIDTSPRALRALWGTPRGELSDAGVQQPGRALWALRIAPVAQAAGMPEQALRLARWALVRSHGLDPDALALARALAPPRADARPEAWLPRALARADSSQTAALAAVRPRLLTVRGEDGFALRGGVVPAVPGAPLALVAPPAEALTLADFDSLAAQLHREGLAVAWLDSRGARASAAPGCAWPEAWAGREEEGERRAARDLARAIGPAARLARADSTRVLVIGAGTSALPAALAARQDPRVRALLLAAPAPVPEEHGWLRETLREAGTPVYFQTGPEELDSNALVDALVLGLPATQFRVADSGGAGTGAALFREGPEVGRRFTLWLRAAWPAQHATPRARPR